MTAVVLLTVGPVLLLLSGAVALNVRGAARGLESWAAANHARVMQARGELGPSYTAPSARFFRWVATLIVMCGLVFTLGGCLELL
ncbi:MAG TPA: hypothetical protein VIS09_27160 [Streptomyces sp.]